MNVVKQHPKTMRDDVTSLKQIRQRLGMQTPKNTDPHRRFPRQSTFNNFTSRLKQTADYQFLELRNNTNNFFYTHFQKRLISDRYARN